VSASPSGSFAFSLRVGAALAVQLPPLWLRLRFEREDARAFQLVRDCARSVLRLSGCRVSVLNPEHVAMDGAAMLVSNHVSLADAAVLLAALPIDFRFVAGHAYADYPLLGAAIRGASANIVNRGSWRSRADSGQAMVDALEGGQSLLVFPEGTTADDGNMLPFRNGAFRAAARTGRPVVPIAIRGTREMFPPGATRLANVPVEIEILPPIRPAGCTRDAITELRDRAAAAIHARSKITK
jgi:1-acyl-sn-glycerol-3-phosphate acyltransferase